MIDMNRVYESRIAELEARANLLTELLEDIRSFGCIIHDCGWLAGKRHDQLHDRIDAALKSKEQA